MEVLECPFEIATLFNVVLEDSQMTRLAGWLAPQVSPSYVIWDVGSWVASFKLGALDTSSKLFTP